jgi:hypothetical protein
LSNYIFYSSTYYYFSIIINFCFTFRFYQYSTRLIQNNSRTFNNLISF